MLLPAKAEVARQLDQYRSWERLLVADPADRAVRTHFENTAYTLCVLMGESTARAAADAAERYLRPRTTCRPRPAPRLSRPTPDSRGSRHA
ncbi:DUF5133 domain-containing protein [Streptomyces aureoverticillatus]|uniref:DUF5133 domain-containing protein n=1 Tax=Streptomyces aureoverticillatus TaxID=66871 RepID=UPI0013DBFC82|nr:DUF5133 domain-containing protein [Streptomyces aureoverticillatus]QIB48643.1 DUF5133 domain-containing protein [Streptomyces aureoverticillatus]